MAWLPADIHNELSNYTTGVWFHAKKVGYSGMVLEDILISEPYKPTTVIPRLGSNVHFLRELPRWPFDIEGDQISRQENLWIPKTITIHREGESSIFYSPVVHEIFSKKIL